MLSEFLLAHKAKAHEFINKIKVNGNTTRGTWSVFYSSSLRHLFRFILTPALAGEVITVITVSLYQWIKNH